MSENKISYSSLPDNVLAKYVRSGNNTAFNELAVRYLRTINFIARKFSAEGYEQKDFVQEGLLGLLYSCRTFDENEASSFKSYMSVVVERRFISIIRKSNSQRAVPKGALVQMDDISEAVEDSAKSPEEIVLCREHLKSVIEQLKTILSKTEYDVISLYVSGLSYREIADRLSVSEKSADNALQRARRKICSSDMS